MTKYVAMDRVARVEEKVAKRWVSGSGEHAVFADDTQGWWLTFESCPASMYLGAEEPHLKAGDRVRLTVERL